MNVTGTTAPHTTQASSHTLPIRRNADVPTVETGNANAKATPSNPAHLGNHVDTTA